MRVADVCRKERGSITPHQDMPGTPFSSIIYKTTRTPDEKGPEVVSSLEEDGKLS